MSTEREETPEERIARIRREETAREAATGQKSPVGGLLEMLLAWLGQLLDPEYDAQLGRRPTDQDREDDRKHGIDPGVTSRDAVAAASRAVGRVRDYLEQNSGSEPVNHINPVAGNCSVSSGCGHRHDPMHGGASQHHGVDFAPEPRGSKPPILASAAGIVEFSGQQRGYGNIVILRHPDGTTTRYAHLDSVGVEAGQILRQGEQLGVMGTTGRSTGVHLHYEQRDKDGNVRNPAIEGRTLVVGDRPRPSERAAAAQVTPATEPASERPREDDADRTRADALDAARGAVTVGLVPSEGTHSPATTAARTATPSRAVS